METFTLNDGVVIPSVGFGVFMIPVGDETYNAVRTALSLGYRHIDTAAAYFNEADVGRAIRDSGILREEIFVTSKLWLQDYGYEPAKKGIETSLKNLGLGYIDLYLIHQPYGDVPGAWKAMEEAKKEGKIRSHRRFQHDTEDLELLRSPVRHHAKRQPGRMQPALPAEGNP